jgi:hypothetical protein
VIAELNSHFRENPGTGWGAVNISPACSTTSNFRVLSQPKLPKVCVGEPQIQQTQQKWQSITKDDDRQS